MNVKNKIKDTMIGTIASILSNSSIYKEETIIVAMAFNETETKIKISARNVGNQGRNVREVLEKIITPSKEKWVVTNLLQEAQLKEKMNKNL